MKKKQLFAVLLAGSMTVGMAPAAAFAAEDTASEAEAQSGAESEGTAENTGDSNNADGAEAQNQDGEQAAAEAQKQAEEQAAAEAQKQAEEQAAAEAQKQAEEQAAAEAQKQAEEQAAAQTQAVTNEDSQQSPVVRNEAELKTAIENAASVDTTTTSVTEAEPSKIVISGTIELTGTVTIPENKSIAIFGENDQAVIERADSFRGNLFEVRSGSAFYMAKKDAANSEGTEGTLKVDGSVTDGSAVDGSLVYVAEGANFSLTTGITLCNNNTNAKGAAILNEGGNVLLTGGTITGNKSDNGAIYSTGVLSLEKGNGAADTEPSITGNFRADNTTPANIILSGAGRIEVKGELTAATVGFSVEEPRADYAAIVSADGLDANVYAKALQVLAPQYEGDTTQFTVDETTGKLISSEKPAPNVTKADFTKWNSATEAVVTIQSDKDGQYYYKLVKHGAAAPDIDTSKEGTAIAANKATNIKLSKLDANTSYDVYVCVKDSDGLVSELKKIELDQSKRPKQEETKKTAPKITKASFTKWNSITEALVTVQSDKAGQYYYKLVKHGATAPKIDTSKAGTAIAANKATNIKLSKLDANTSYDVYVCVKDSDGLVSELKKIELDQSKRPKQEETKKTAPKITKASFTKWNSITEALVTVQSDKAGQYYYKLVKHGATAPKIDTSKAGTAIAANKATNIKLSKLDANTSYDVYVCVKDSDGLVSELKKIELDQSKRPKQEETKKTAPKITKASFSKWNSATEAVVTIQSDKDGKYYYQVVEHGTKVSSISTDGDGNDITADNPTDITISDLAADKNYDVYVCVKDSDGVSSLKVIELDQSGRPKKNSTIKLKWTGFQWTSHESASVTLRANVTGTCYYAWAERNDDGTSEQPKIDTNSSTQSVSISADKNFTIYLNDLNADNGIDLYIRIKDSEGNVSGLKKLKFKQDTRPAKSDPEHTPNVPEVTKSILKGLDDELEFYPNTFYDFTVIGAGTTNSNPGEGDVKWEPLYWSTSSNPSDAQKHSSWKIGSTKGITKAATYNLYVFFRKWIYTGGQWVETDTVESAVYQFRSADITVTPSGAADGSNSGGQTGADPEATTEASATSANGDGTTSRSAVSTADNSPIGTMSALAVASLLAGGYVIVRRRKKDI